MREMYYFRMGHALLNEEGIFLRQSIILILGADISVRFANSTGELLVLNKFLGGLDNEFYLF